MLEDDNRPDLERRAVAMATGHGHRELEVPTEFDVPEQRPVGAEPATRELPVRQLSGEAAGAEASRAHERRSCDVRVGDGAALDLRTRPHVYALHY